MENNEFDTFNNAMDRILKADPARVKAEVDADIQSSLAERTANGERKRGRKPKSSSAHKEQPK
jgi:hypothetical protein